MVPLHSKKTKQAFHEPYTQLIGNERSDRRRFMPSTHVKILEVFPFHEPNPLTLSLSPNGGEGVRRTGEGDRLRFKVPMLRESERGLSMNRPVIGSQTAVRKRR
jgi:hypothetical protein